MTARIVLLTGATSAIGHAIAARLLDAGHSVFATGASRERLEGLAASRTADATQMGIMAADLTEAGAPEAVFDACRARFGRLDILVHCAGSSTPMPVFAPNAAAWRREFAINVESFATLSARALSDMRPRRWGRIVAIGSIYATLGRNAAFYAGRDPPEDDRGPWRNPAYAASKGALVNLVRDLAAAAGGFGVTVNCVSPGMIDIPNRPIPPEREALMAASTPLARLGTPEDVAGAVAFLASEDSGFITGINLPVDGGWSIW